MKANDKLGELADDIRENGYDHRYPITVAEIGDIWMLLDGRNRREAARIDDGDQFAAPPMPRDYFRGEPLIPPKTRSPPTLPAAKFKIIPIIMNESSDVAMSS